MCTTVWPSSIVLEGRLRSPLSASGPCRGFAASRSPVESLTRAKGVGGGAVEPGRAGFEPARAGVSRETLEVSRVGARIPGKGSFEPGNPPRFPEKVPRFLGKLWGFLGVPWRFPGRLRPPPVLTWPQAATAQGFAPLALVPFVALFVQLTEPVVNRDIRKDSDDAMQDSHNANSSGAARNGKEPDKS